MFRRSRRWVASAVPLPPNALGVTVLAGLVTVGMVEPPPTVAPAVKPATGGGAGKARMLSALKGVDVDVVARARPPPPLLGVAAVAAALFPARPGGDGVVAFAAPPLLFVREPVELELVLSPSPPLLLLTLVLLCGGALFFLLGDPTPRSGMPEGRSGDDIL